MGTGTGFWTVVTMFWQFSGGGNARGRTLVIGFLLLLFAGGTLLLIRGMQGLLRSRKALKRPADTGRKKAA
jgi:hypothetical protein